MRLGGVGELLRLDREDDDARRRSMAAAGSSVAVTPCAFVEVLAAGGDDLADGDVAGAGDVARDGAGDDRLAHHAAADERELHVRALPKMARPTRTWVAPSSIADLEVVGHAHRETRDRPRSRAASAQAIGRRAVRLAGSR